MQKTTKISVRALARKSKCDRDSIARWIQGCETEEQALKAIAERKVPLKAGGTDADGMSWWHAYLKERALKLRRENAQAAGIEAGTWMATADHFKIVAAVASRLELIPGKVSSELGLSPGQTLAIRKALDQARQVAAKIIEGMEGSPEL